ncbi:type I restriction-modification system subunit M [Halomonas ramblicola]|uniref:type I restriction-modification system subunit M n=1 Tax=Halomonas ramblicola TaxID=747349 RepID=UPI0025B463E4|nr:class I SAM-dependent DNA methyltransferase [Halomonas ramblicola]MDN3523077.1 class I SAM-dependent DNA methyltransferase [Halomonas ramblicola]
MAISSTIKSIQDIMRKDVGVDGDAQRIGQLVWMLFLKIFDDREQEWEMFDENYRSPIPEPLRWRNWAADPEGMTGNELKEFVDTMLFPGLQQLQPRGDDTRGVVIRNVFEDAYNYMKSGQLMRQVINKLQDGIDFNTQADRHQLGDMYEQILKDLQSAGNAGEFYTPRAVTEFMVNRVDPKLDEIVMDPACGTGGFLTCTIEHKRSRYVTTTEDEQVLQTSIRGIDKKPLPHLLATTNMILHGIEVPEQVRHDNALARPLRDWSPRERVDAIVANPPFGGMEEDGIETNFPQAFRTRETADLFMTLFIHLLKDGGRAAVVLPDGFLFGEGMKTRLKEKLLTECNLHTIVRLPNGVFNPYTGIKTNLLFFTKGQPTEQIWYYEHPYPEGYKSYSKTKPMRFAEFATEIDWWGDESDGFASRQETEQAWKVDIDEIKARHYNLDIKNPWQGEEVSHDPDELLEKYARQQAEIQELRDQLKEILGDALSHTVTEGRA